MSHARPLGTGWVAGQPGTPIEVQADPPGDGIGPDLTPPDAVSGMDPKELKRLRRDHERAVKGDGEQPDISAPEPVDVKHEPVQRADFGTPPDPREGKGDR